MSNIEYLRELHHKKLNLKRAQFRVKEFYSTKKTCVKDLIFIYYVNEKSLDIRRFIMPGNKLLLIFIDDLNRLAFAKMKHNLSTSRY